MMETINYVQGAKDLQSWFEKRKIRPIEALGIMQILIARIVEAALQKFW